MLRIKTAYNEFVHTPLRRLVHRFTLILVLSLTLSFVTGMERAFAQGAGQASEPVYYPQTGHWVTGDFLKTFQDVRDPIKIYGYPITEAFQDQTLGHIVQYFQRTRFELYPENPPELRVTISPLGKYLYSPGTALPIPENFPACRFFEETGFQVCYTFLDFFLSNGGAAQFGYPISNFEIHEGRIMQYFQRARMEWHPELASGQRVVLSDLGRAYFDTIHENPVRLLPAAVRDNRPQAILSLQARAFPAYAVLPLSGVQTFYIIVQDQNLQPVSKVQVTLAVKLPGGKEQHIVIPASTDKNGVVRFDYSYSDQATGIVAVQVEAGLDGLKATTETSFRIWW